VVNPSFPVHGVRCMLPSMLHRQRSELCVARARWRALPWPVRHIALEHAVHGRAHPDERIAAIARRWAAAQLAVRGRCVVLAVVGAAGLLGVIGAVVPVGQGWGTRLLVAVLAAVTGATVATVGAYTLREQAKEIAAANREDRRPGRS